MIENRDRRQQSALSRSRKQGNRYADARYGNRDAKRSARTVARTRSLTSSPSRLVSLLAALAAICAIAACALLVSQAPGKQGATREAAPVAASVAADSPLAKTEGGDGSGEPAGKLGAKAGSTKEISDGGADAGGNAGNGNADSKKGETEKAGDELEEAKASLARKQAALDGAEKEISALQRKIRSMQEEIDAAAGEIEDLESELVRKQDALASYAVFLYKNPYPHLMEYMLDADDLSQVVARTELIYGYADDMAQEAAAQRKRKESLEERIAEISAQKDAQMADKRELKKKEKKLEEQVDALEDKAARLDAERKIAEFEATHAAFDTDFSSGEWRTCTASAYGGSSDSMTPNNARTATGAICNDWSMGVAIPMRWSNYRSYFGRKVEISYNGKSVISHVNDCGGMSGGGPGGERGLDLQPGVFKALGASSCQDWGLRAVKYRFL